MAMDIKKVEILLFDSHLALNPLSDPSLVRPECTWLVDQRTYNELYSGTEPPPSTAHFAIHRVRREKRHNLFWKAYEGIADSLSPSWDKVTPFRFVPRREFLSLESSPALGSAEPQIRSWIFVWPFGWSSSLHLTLQGPLTLIKLRQQMNLILETRVFQAGREPLSLVEVFQRLSNALRADLYGAGKLVGDYIHKPRHQVIAVTASDPPFPRYDDARLAHGDWARIFAVVLGSQVKPADVTRLKDELLISTNKKDGTFAVTDFDRGSFLLLSGASRRGKGERSSSCMTHNLETASLVGLMFSGFIQAVKARRISNERIDALVRGAQSVLMAIPTRYPNFVCQHIWQKHGSLKPYWAAAQSSSAPPPA